MTSISESLLYNNELVYLFIENNQRVMFLGLTVDFGQLIGTFFMIYIGDGLAFISSMISLDEKIIVSYEYVAINYIAVYNTQSELFEAYFENDPNDIFLGDMSAIQPNYLLIVGKKYQSDTTYVSKCLFSKINDLNGFSSTTSISFVNAVPTYSLTTRPNNSFTISSITGKYELAAEVSIVDTSMVETEYSQSMQVYTDPHYEDKVASNSVVALDFLWT